ncbi:MAG TPA: radical SAM/SPASM domain-containing protein [Dissulfurispiraceae bacterium]|nr:radical SAM/SPASM domain-containing protein [Dissulfurispiraceae bacterium]
MNYPEYIQFFPTLRCNRHCGFCFNRGLETEGEITADAFEKLAGKILAAGIGEVDILGGEPTLHPDIVRFIDKAATLRLRLNLSTNGTNIPLLEHLSGTYDRNTLNIGISLNDSRMAKELEDYIVRYRPFIKSVCQKTAPLPASIYFGMPGITCYLLYMDTITESDLLNGMPFDEFYKQMSVLRDRYPDVAGVYCGGFLPDTKKQPVLRNTRCPAGTTKLSILPDGSVYPCYLFFRRREFRLGNIFTESFEDLCGSPILNYFRKFQGNKCPVTACELFSECHGGCPAVSLLICNDLDAPDPRCTKGNDYLVLNGNTGIT